MSLDRRLFYSRVMLFIELDNEFIEKGRRSHWRYSEIHLTESPVAALGLVNHSCPTQTLEIDPGLLRNMSVQRVGHFHDASDVWMMRMMFG